MQKQQYSRIRTLSVEKINMRPDVATRKNRDLKNSEDNNELNVENIHVSVMSFVRLSVTRFN